MRPQDIITKKRDGKRLSGEEINSFIRGVTDGSWADYQISAMIMAMYINELNSEEQSLITSAMLNSGVVLDFSDIPGPKADKHSTGGVGDKTSLIIAPLAAACGLTVPMISGRGLGHTGGTLDKLESIPGFKVSLTTGEFQRIVKLCGYAMSGQTADIAPADKKIYALRDATATVPTIPLIVASIMSKKLAEGLDALVLDVKTGNGAFMDDYQDAVRLAEALVQTGKSCGVKTRALITDMNQPLGAYIGNSLEVFECIEILKGKITEPAKSAWELSKELAAQMLVLSGISDDAEAARTLAETKLTSGHAFEKFCQNVSLQGGDPTIFDDPESLIDTNLVESPIVAAEDGYIAGIDTKEIGNSICIIGGGRLKAEDSVDPAVGFRCRVSVGDPIRAGDVLGTLLCRNDSQADSVAARLKLAFSISSERPETLKLVKQIIS